jgi:iron complex transport system ATP-binding protein
MRLIATDLGVTIGGRKLLNGISFTMNRGELVLIVGPNGAGKTTLLKAIGGLLPFEGALTWMGESLAGVDAADRARLLAYLPQGHVAHWPIMARDVVAIGRAPLSSSLISLKASDEIAIAEAIEAVEAASFADRPVTELSGGERARIMLARALVVGAPILLADEPVASLDPEHQLAVMAILQRRAETGGLIIGVSHDLIMAERFADRILVLRGGEVAAFGSPRDALSDEILRDVFRIEALKFQAGSRLVRLPWSIAR